MAVKPLSADSNNRACSGPSAELTPSSLSAAVSSATNSRITGRPDGHRPHFNVARPLYERDSLRQMGVEHRVSCWKHLVRKASSFTPADRAGHFVAKSPSANRLMERVSSFFIGDVLPAIFELLRSPLEHSCCAAHVRPDRCAANLVR